MSRYNTQSWSLSRTKLEPRNQTSCLECYQIIILSIVHLAMSNCKFSNRNVSWPTMWLQGCRDLHVHHWKLKFFFKDSPWYLIIFQSFSLPIVINNNIDELSWVRSSFWHHKIFPTAIKSNKPIISWRHYLLEPSCSFEGDVTTDHWILIIRSHGSLLFRFHVQSLSVGKYYKSDFPDLGNKFSYQ